MKEKIKKLHRKYQTENFLFTNRIETFYLSGAPFDGFWLLAANGGLYAVCSEMISSQVKEFFAKSNIHIYIGVPFSKAAAEILKENKAANVIIDTKQLSAADFLSIGKRFAEYNIKITPKTGLLDELRMVKNQKEAENLRKACKIVSEVCDLVRKEINPGMSELDIHYRILELFAVNRVKESFTPIVAAGKNSAKPHHASSNYKINENDIVMMDIGCVYNGYCSDLTRTYLLGKINGKIKEVWDIVKASQSAVLKLIKAGLPVSSADKAAREVIEAAGYKDKFIHTTGHGVGIEIHEMPSLSKNAEGVFLQNMAVTVEPGIYLENEFGVRIEDTVLITENGCEILTSAEY